MAIPDIVTESSIDDAQSIDLDLGSLKRKFIDPIDQVRSLSTPNVLDSRQAVGVDDEGRAQAAQRQLNASGIRRTPQESRAHTFYRMLGLPVVGNDGSFYNPGFNPKLGNDARLANEKIASRVPESVKRMHALRENGVRADFALFDRAGTSASVKAVAMGLPNGQRSFQVLDASKGIFDVDLQQQKLPERRVEIQRSYKHTNGNDLTEFFDVVSHRLRPFMVDPTIDRTVKPQRRLIAHPFLKSKNDTRIEPNVYLFRPGIEFILRLRLRQFNERGELLTALTETTLRDNAIDLAQINVSDLAVVASAIFNNSNVQLDDLNELLAIKTSVEIININNLVKTIKGLISIYIEALSTIRKVQKNISWKPLPSSGGPEFGTEISNFISTKNIQGELESRIVQLNIKQFNSKRQFQLDENGNFSNADFAISEFENTQRLFEDELNRAKARRRSIEKKGSDALRVIELITGEVSGLGLIDILAIYTALWAVDLDTLVSLLDNNAFRNLYDNNRDLRTEPVTNRNASGPVFGVQEALGRLEEQISSILSFADRLFVNAHGNPKEAEGGNISRSV